jgi:hypothetical protein
VIGRGEVFDSDGCASGAGELGKDGAKFIEGSVKGNVFQFESGFPTDGPEFGLGGLDRGTTDVEVFF